MEKHVFINIVITLISIVVLTGAIACTRPTPPSAITPQEVSPTQEVLPQEETPSEEMPSPQEIPPPQEALCRIQINVTSSTWREGEEPYNIYRGISGKLEEAGLEVIPEERNAYDAVLFVDYRESKGSEYETEIHLPAGYGTSIKCNLELYDQNDHLLWEEEIRGGSPRIVEGSLYNAALTDFKTEVTYEYLGDIIAVQTGCGPGSEEYGKELESLIQGLESGIATECCDAAGILGRIGDPEAVEPLIWVLEEHQIQDARVIAAIALGEIADARALEPLIATMKDENEWEWIRVSAAEALGKIGDASTVEALTEALSDQNQYVSDAAQEALDKLK